MSTFVALCVLWAVAGAAAGDDEEDLGPGPPGLVVAFSDGQRSVVVSADRLAFRLSEGESPHPQIGPERFTARWVGRLHVVRPGKYRFRAEVLGEFTLRLAGQAVLAAGDNPLSQKWSRYVELPFGPTELEATYAKSRPGGAALQLFWQREGEFQETVAAAALKHAPAHETAAFRDGRQIEEGRRLFAEYRCAACHMPDQHAAVGLPTPRGPRLEALRGQVAPAWLAARLAEGQALRPDARMPRMFGDSPQELAEARAAAVFLAGQPSRALGQEPPPDENLVRHGEQVFLTIGCIACHRVPGEKLQQPSPELVPLDGVADKLTRQALVRRLTQPQSVNPDSRMPDFQFARQPAKLDALVAYLSRLRGAAVEGLNAGGEAGAEPALRELGRSVVQSRGCLNCHELPEVNNTSAAAPPLSQIARLAGEQGAGAPFRCRAGAAEAVALDHRLTEDQRGALRAFLARGTSGAAGLAPLMAAAWHLDRRGCTACHEINGRGGTFAQRILEFVPLGTDQTIKDVAPPELAAIGEKLHRAAIERVVTGDTRARPWMALQMPRFDKEQAAGLIESLVKLDGIDPALPPPAPPKSTPALLEQGRLLVGRTGFNCVSCHDIRGVRSTGVRGPDLAQVTARVTHDWFRRWMLDPQRITPGTRMPSVFFGGKSAAPQILGGDPEAQMAALWAYLAQGESLALPPMPPTQAAAVEGGESPRFVPQERPLVVHGFMPGTAGLRGIAAGFPAGIHFAFDSERCQLVRAWTGGFAEVGGWFDTGRGTAEDNAVKVLGQPIWQGPDDAALRLETGGGPPALPQRVQFEACWTTKTEVGFAYRLVFAGHSPLHVEERLAAADGSHFTRQVRLREVPPDRQVRLALAGEKPAGLYVLVKERAGGPVRRATDGSLRLAAGPNQLVEVSLLYAARAPRDAAEEQAWRARLLHGRQPAASDAN